MITYYKPEMISCYNNVEEEIRQYNQTLVQQITKHSCNEANNSMIWKGILKKFNS